MFMETDTKTHEMHSIPDLLRELRDESSTLFRQEIALAKTELKEKTSKLSRNAIYLVAGGVIAYSGLIFILLGVVGLIGAGLVAAGMEAATAAWVSPLILGFIVAIIGAAMLMKGKRTLAEESLVPEKTLQSLKEDTSWTRAKIQQA
jgi:hypothetical protein